MISTVVYHSREVDYVPRSLTVFYRFEEGEGEDYTIRTRFHIYIRIIYRYRMQ